jgi:hypothetical protein
VAEINAQSTLPDEAAMSARGVAPADRRAHRRWPWWKIALAYGVLFGVAVGSIWVIDGHVLTATPRVPATNGSH